MRTSSVSTWRRRLRLPRRSAFVGLTGAPTPARWTSPTATRSTRHWTTLQARAAGSGIAFDPGRPDTIYVGVEEGGIFRSRDRGVSFEAANHNIHPDIHCVVVDPDDSRRIYATTGRGLYVSPNAGTSWRTVRGLSRSYTIPIMVSHGRDAVYTAAAAGPPPTWSIGAVGADAMMFRSSDRGESFRPLVGSGGFLHPTRGMVMRLREDSSGTLLGALSDGSLIRISDSNEAIASIAEKLPPTYDFVALPGA